MLRSKVKSKPKLLVVWRFPHCKCPKRHHHTYFTLVKYSLHKNHCRKVKETTGLQLTKVQEVYWRAVQRRMILSQLESLINDNLELIKQREIKVPYELAMSLMKCDPGKLFIYTRKLHGR